MQKIKYIFADGTTSEIEVTDELYALHLELVQQEKRNHWRETRRHISLNYLSDKGIDIESNAADPLDDCEQRDNEKRIHNPVQSEQEFLTYLKTLPDLRYVVFQREKAPERETEHYQGYFEFTQQKMVLTTIKSNF